ncbi:phage tail protein [Providencia huaxiensis]|uniref:phage tail-collar fiber domain-containing protein n=1 Tax=Providencia huaxiensis TaxID=2027290 RepID=UPI0034DD37FD
MKYFALLTKLGENLLAQATALGTKLELTHMAVGDGSGSLPTPDTNQTKLIAEKRRAAINTLFIDDKNKNQIIAEQIIPEQDGGWWIREIGLFDKAGNLIAVANCPETYKPQLAEGSGRTQSIRMVLIVSHTESVTLKIDPSVVLATREYVNTEITVIDKKIDALSAQSKLDLNKKFDKANISGQKGNDNDKVPSLNLFTTEIGKLAALGYSYSKIESDGRYATNTALTNGLNGKFDKTGGTVSGIIETQKTIASIVPNKAGVQLDGSGEEPVVKARKTSLTGWRIHKFPDKSGTLMHLGDNGFGGESPLLPVNSDLNTYSEINQNINALYTLAGSYINAPKPSMSGILIVLCRKTGYTHDEITHIIIDDNIEYSRSRRAGVWSIWEEKYSTKNTIIDRNGCLKISSSNEISDYTIGSPIPWPQATVPAGFLVCNGQSFNKITYPLLAKAYPSGILPDLRGEFIRGLDAGRNIDTGRTALSAQNDAIQNITGSFRIQRALINMFTGAFVEGEATTKGNDNSGGDMGRVVHFDASKVVRTANENRPRNIAFLYIVRAA